MKDFPENKNFPLDLASRLTLIQLKCVCLMWYLILEEQHFDVRIDFLEQISVVVVSVVTVYLPFNTMAYVILMVHKSLI